MKVIIVEMEDDVFRQLEQELHVKNICGNLWGASDAFIFRVLSGIRNGAARIHLAMPPKKAAR